jgi:hypothetical protein
VKTLAKSPTEQLIEGRMTPLCDVADATWNPDSEIPYWAIWSTGVHQGTLMHLKHFPDAMLAAPVATAKTAHRELFDDFAQQWEADTEFVSRQTEAVMHPAY